MDLKSMNFEEDFNKTSKEIADGRKMIRDAIMQVIQAKDDFELAETRMQRIKSELGNYGFTSENVDDEKNVLDSLKKDFVRDPVMSKLHSSLFYADENCLKKLKEFVYSDKDSVKEITKIDLYGVIEKRIFLFQDIPTALDGRSIQKALREIDEETLAKALLGETFSVKQKFLKNISERMQLALKNEMKKYAATTDEKEIYENQMKIIRVINELIETNVIIPEGKFSDIERLCY